MSNLSNQRIFSFTSGDGFVKTIHKQILGEQPEMVKRGLVRVDDVRLNPLKININSSTLVSYVNDYVLEFSDLVGEEEFFNELFFVIEELNNVPEEDRISSGNKIINLNEELISLKGEKNGKKHNDR